MRIDRANILTKKQKHTYKDTIKIDIHTKYYPVIEKSKLISIRRGSHPLIANYTASSENES